MRDPKGDDRSDVSCPARPSAQELRELSSRRACTLTRLALTLVGCGGLLEWKQSYQAKHVIGLLVITLSEFAAGSRRAR